MKKDITNLTRELFNDKEVFTFIGFSPQESEIFYLLIQGFSISKIALKLNLSPRKISYIKGRRFHLIPVFVQRKLSYLSKIDLVEINDKIINLNLFLQDYITFFKNQQNIPITNLNLSKRTINSLLAFNIKNTADLILHSSQQLLNGKNIGDKALLEIQIELDRLNLKLKD